MCRPKIHSANKECDAQLRFTLSPNTEFLSQRFRYLVQFATACHKMALACLLSVLSLSSLDYRIFNYKPRFRY